MVKPDGIDHLFMLIELGGQVGSEHGMVAFGVLVDRFANIMEQPTSLGSLHIQSHLRSHDAADMSGLDGMLQHGLDASRAELQTSNVFNQLWVQICNSDIECR